MAGRVRFIEAHAAANESIAAALVIVDENGKRSKSDLGETDLRVLLAVHSLTCNWSRLSDRQSLSQIAKAAGLDAIDDPNLSGEDRRKKQHANVERRVSRSLRRLAAVGAITYTPARGRGHLSEIGIPAAKGDPRVTLLGGEKVTPGAKKGDPAITRKVTHQSPTQGSTSVNQGLGDRPPLKAFAELDQERAACPDCFGRGEYLPLGSNTMTRCPCQELAG